MIGFLKKLPAFPSCIGFGSFDHLISAIVSAICAGVSDISDVGELSCAMFCVLFPHFSLFSTFPLFPVFSICRTSVVSSFCSLVNDLVSFRYRFFISVSCTPPYVIIGCGCVESASVTSIIKYLPGCCLNMLSRYPK